MQRFYQYNGDVAESLDLTLLPFHRIKGQDWPQLPGLVVSLPPRRTARGREADRLVLYLTISGNIPFSSSEYNQITSRMVGQFYQTPGSLTSAIRTTAEAINQALVERNLRTTGKGQYIIGRLVLGVLRGTQFVFAQCGPTHVFHLRKDGAGQVHDAQISGRGLGIGQTTPIYFSQLDLQPGEQLVLCADLPEKWEEALRLEKSGSPEALRRKLSGITDGDLNAVLAQVQAGRGELNLLKLGAAAPVPAPASEPAPEIRPPVRPPVQPAAGMMPAEAAPSRPSSQVQSGRPASRFTRLLSGEQPQAETSEPKPESTALPAAVPPVAAAVPARPQGALSQPVRRPVTSPVVSPPRTAAQSGRFVTPRTTGELPEIKRTGGQNKQVFRWFARVIRGARSGAHRAGQGVKSFLPNLLPARKEGEGEFGSSGMALIAIVVPILVVVVATMVYGRYGSTAGYQEKFALALEQASLARSQTNPTDIRRAWETTLFYLDQADDYQKTQDASVLRQEAQTALDNLDSIVRLDFREAIIGGLSRTIQVTRMAATNTDLYLLDSSRGVVLRSQLSSQGYEVDMDFECGPGVYNEITVDRLIDIEAIQMSNIYNARVVGIDARGNLLYCGFNMTPTAVQLVQPPFGWKSISVFSLDPDGKNLYVLDPVGNAVWVYQGGNASFTELPVMFFGEQVPQGLDTVIDLAANNADLYLLFPDGHVTACPADRYDVVPMRCTDPATYVDTRLERVSGPVITDAIFNQMVFASAPDPSLYMLEPLTKAVYRFSPRSDSLELRGQFRAGTEQSTALFTNPATAMVISPNRYLFISMGSQVFFATDVP